MRSIKHIALASVVAVGAVGCGNMSGLDAKDSFSCKAPDGVLCESMSGIYANAQANNLPGQRVNRKGGGQEVSRAKVDQGPSSGVMTRPITSGTPIRSAPVVLRVWFAPWEDTDGDLHDQSYVYLPVDTGKWLVEHNRRRIQDNYRPVRAPAAPTAAAPAAMRVTPPQISVEGVVSGEESSPGDSPSIVESPRSMPQEVPMMPADRVPSMATLPSMPSYPPSPSMLSPGKLEEARRATDELTRKVMRGMPAQ